MKLVHKKSKQIEKIIAIQTWFRENPFGRVKWCGVKVMNLKV